MYIDEEKVWLMFCTGKPEEAVAQLGQFEEGGDCGLGEENARKFVRRLWRQKDVSLFGHIMASARFHCSLGVGMSLLSLPGLHVTSPLQLDREGPFKGQFGFICPDTLSEEKHPGLHEGWKDSCAKAEWSYRDLLRKGVRPDIASSVMSLSVASDFIVTMTLVGWRETFERIISPVPFTVPSLRRLLIPIAAELQVMAPTFFGELNKWIDSIVKKEA